MPERQLHLFSVANPLAARLGSEFFRGIPREPGVYIMTGADDRVLYIGQSGNLRARLGSYKNAQPDRAPRKVIRLVHQVRSITWERCASVEAARLRENQLLRMHRPKFNRANVYPRAYAFIWQSQDEHGLVLGRTNNPALAGALRCEQQAKLYGAFKSFASAGYGALLRLLWAVARQPAAPSDFPAGLLQENPPRSFTVPWPCAQNSRLKLRSHLQQFLEGVSDELLSFFRSSLPDLKGLCAFLRALYEHDLQILAQFYERSPKRNRAFIIQHQLESHLIPQERLDDYLLILSER